MKSELFIRIPLSTGEAELKRLFSSYGIVLYVRIIRNKRGQNRGWGFIQMKTAEQAERAKALNGTRLSSGGTLIVDDAKDEKINP